MASNRDQVINLVSLYHRFEELKVKHNAKGKTLRLGNDPGGDEPRGIAESVALRGSWIAQILGLRRKICPAKHTPKIMNG